MPNSPEFISFVFRKTSQLSNSTPKLVFTYVLHFHHPLAWFPGFSVLSPPSFTQFVDFQVQAVSYITRWSELINGRLTTLENGMRKEWKRYGLEGCFLIIVNFSLRTLLRFGEDWAFRVIGHVSVHMEVNAICFFDSFDNLSRVNGVLLHILGSRM
ncbi:hypothetical protein TNCV_1545501 [Trichonephila clavipes]|nr:hypothetical protein TNCV_1545501 [Trichonephila clavipes]